MNWTHLHLIINHFPIILPLVAFAILAIGLIGNNRILYKTAFFIFIIAMIFTKLSMISGDKSEDMVNQIIQTADTLIEIHEDKAEIYSKFVYILGLFSAIGLYTIHFSKRTIVVNMLSLIILIITVFSIYFGYQTGSSGGAIVHSEIHSDRPNSTDHNEENEQNND